MDIAIIHHVSVPVTDVERSIRFYSEILGLKQMDRPAFKFGGAWFVIGENQQLHLIKDEHKKATFRKGTIDSHDTHFAVRVASYSKALTFLKSRGYSDVAAPDDLKVMKISKTPPAGFPQIYILDPDRHVIEINAQTLDEEV